MCYSLNSKHSEVTLMERGEAEIEGYKTLKGISNAKFAFFHKDVAVKFAEIMC